MDGNRGSREKSGARLFRFGRASNSEARNPKLLVVLVPVLLAACGALWQTDANRAVEQARTGAYKEAAAALESAVEGGNNDPQVVESLYFSWIRLGQYKKARDKFEAWASARPNSGPIRLAAARSDRMTGDFARALEHLNAVVNTPGVSVAAQLERAEVLAETGKRAESDAAYNKLLDAYKNGSLRTPNDLFYAAKAMWAMEYIHDANDTFKVVTQGNPRFAEAFAAWGDMLAEKYQETEAIASYRDAQKIDPNMPEANIGIARTLDLTNPKESEQALSAVFSVNPDSIEGNIFLANKYIDLEQYDKARESVNKVLEVNPQSAEALSLLASINYLQGNKDDFDKDVQKVLAVNPNYNQLYDTLAENSVSVRLYKEAVGFARDAIRLNPRDWNAMTLLGINLMRIGEDEEGKKTLEAAFEGDSFNVWSYNTLKLLDTFKDYDNFATPNFKVMLYKKESAALKPYVTELVERAFKELTAKYGFKPPTPVSLEMYPNHEDFAVRTLGLTGMEGALGVTFGKMFAMDSPSARKPDTFNWGSTLWHEFTHVITLEMTDHKIPRWFSEGLSVYEERRGFPGWGDDLKMEYLKAIQEKKLLPVANLNDGFIRPQYPEQVLVSYYQASMVAEFIEATQGFPAIKRMLLLYKDGKNTEQVFKEALGIDLKDFDDQFFKWIGDRTKGIDAKAFTELASHGEEALTKGDLDGAIESLTKAVEMYPEYTDEGNPYEPLADAYLKKGDKAAAIDTLKKFMKYAETSYDSNLKLADLLKEQGDIAGEEQTLMGAIYIRPLDLQCHEKLGTALLSEKKYAPAAREYETLIALNTPDRAGAFFHLAEANFGAGDRQEARKNVLKSLEIAPSYEPALELLLKIKG